MPAAAGARPRGCRTAGRPRAGAAHRVLHSRHGVTSTTSRSPGPRPATLRFRPASGGGMRAAAHLVRWQTSALPSAPRAPCSSATAAVPVPDRRRAERHGGHALRAGRAGRAVQATRFTLEGPAVR